MIVLGLATTGRSKGMGGTERARIPMHICVYSPLTDRTSVSVIFQKVFQKWTSRFWVMRSNSAPLSSGSMAYLPEVKKDSKERTCRKESWSE
uniref:Uncharacterized protein n=1 Tax=Myripristis murdjan TaxID=586833 RepID=A0A667ZT52_9TELE